MQIPLRNVWVPVSVLVLVLSACKATNTEEPVPDPMPVPLPEEVAKPLDFDQILVLLSAAEAPEEEAALIKKALLLDGAQVMKQSAELANATPAEREAWLDFQEDLIELRLARVAMLREVFAFVGKDYLSILLELDAYPDRAKELRKGGRERFSRILNKEGGAQPTTTVAGTE